MTVHQYQCKECESVVEVAYQPPLGSENSSNLVEEQAIWAQTREKSECAPICMGCGDFMVLQSVISKSATR